MGKLKGENPTNANISIDLTTLQVNYTNFEKLIILSFLTIIFMIYTSTLYPHFAGGDRYIIVDIYLL